MTHEGFFLQECIALQIAGAPAELSMESGSGQPRSSTGICKMLLKGCIAHHCCNNTDDTSTMQHSS